ncbi:MAG: TetR/AcrR family transcriptional regulator [Ilumatobacteraceae bacterium]
MTTRPYLAADDRRRALLDAADRLFVRHGFAGMSMVAVADEAGVSRALLYRHFPDQASLNVAMFDERVQRYIEEHVAPAQLPDGQQVETAFDRVRRMPLGDLRALRAALTGAGGLDLVPLRDRLSDYLWSRWSPLLDPPRDEAVTRVAMLSLMGTSLDLAIAVHEGLIAGDVAGQIWTAMTIGAISALPAATTTTPTGI